MKGMRVVELSHELWPGREEYRLEVKNGHVEEFVSGYHRPANAWYIMSDVHMWSHVGTHMESPYHYLEEGQDVADIPLERVVGEAVLLDLSDKGVGQPITRADLEEWGGDVRSGDIVFVHTGLSQNYRTERSHDRPYFTPDSIQWLIDREISCLGVDCSGIEKRDEPSQPDHEALFQHGIPVIEHLSGLEKLRHRRFLVVAVPWRVHGLDACPVSVVALEREGD